MNIDVDSHFTPPSIFDDIPLKYADAPRWGVDKSGKKGLWVEKVERWIRFDKSSYDIQMRINAMREGGYDKQCLNMALHTIPVQYISPETELYLVKAWNDAVSKIVEKNDCFIGVAQVPHRDPQAAIEEARRCVEDLGFSAIHVEGNWAGRNIESYDWWPFFEAVEKLDVPIFSHPTGNASEGYFNPYMPAKNQLEILPGEVSQLFAFLLLHQISMAGLIFMGVLDKFPRLKFAWLETDVGWVPGFMDLLDGFYDSHLMCKAQDILKYLRCNCPVESVALKKRPSAYFKDNYFYSVSSISEMQREKLLPFVVNDMGLGENLMIQTDFDHPEGYLDVARVVRGCEKLDAEAKEMVCGKNAARLLKVKWAPSAYSVI